MDQEGFCDLTHRSCLRMIHLYTLLIIGAVIALDKGMLVGSMGRVHVGLNPQTQQKAHKRRRKIAPGGSTNETRIAIKSDLGR